MANETDFYDKVFKVPDRVREKSYVKSREEYDKMYAESIKDPNAFWAKPCEVVEKGLWWQPSLGKTPCQIRRIPGSWMPLPLSGNAKPASVAWSSIALICTCCTAAITRSNALRS